MANMDFHDRYDWLMDHISLLTNAEKQRLRQVDPDVVGSHEIETVGELFDRYYYATRSGGRKYVSPEKARMAREQLTRQISFRPIGPVPAVRGSGKTPSHLSGWIAFVKQTQKKYNLTYKEALQKASQLRK